MTLSPLCEHVETAQGVPLTVTGVAQCKVMTEKEFLATAAEQFLGKDVDHIKSVILQTLEGHLRAILGMWQVFFYTCYGEKWGKVVLILNLFYYIKEMLAFIYRYIVSFPSTLSLKN